jgi:uncharacterized protein (DUF1684 family)
LGRGQDLLDLAAWRRQVGDLYRLRGPGALDEFRRGRDHLFKNHPQSPIEDRDSFAALDYFPADPAFRVQALFAPSLSDEEVVIDTGGDDGAIRYRRAGNLRFRLAGTECRLTVLSLIAYGGGLFLPFKDATSRGETYGGGRYLFDTVKNTDGLALELEVGSDQVVLDFNYAYNPSCAYNPRWACPLSPPENTVPVAVTAGEKTYGPKSE